MSKYEGLYDNNTSIEDYFYTTFPKSYEYAKDMTERELQQAVEGMYHNLKWLGRLNSNIKNIAI